MAEEIKNTETPKTTGVNLNETDAEAYARMEAETREEMKKKSFLGLALTAGKTIFTPFKWAFWDAPKAVFTGIGNFFSDLFSTEAEKKAKMAQRKEESRRAAYNAFDKPRVEYQASVQGLNAAFGHRANEDLFGPSDLPKPNAGLTGTISQHAQQVPEGNDKQGRIADTRSGRGG